MQSPLTPAEPQCFKKARGECSVSGGIKTVIPRVFIHRDLFPKMQATEQMLEIYIRVCV